MKKIIPLLFILFTITTYAQDQSDYIFGKPTSEELNLKNYALDSTANAIVLLDLGTTKFVNKIDKVTEKRSRIVSTNYYQKIKIFNKEGFKHATFTIFLGENSTILNIKGITHNNLEQTNLEQELIYETTISEGFREVKFTLPNLKEGSLIEVEYTLETPIKFNLTSWTFQSDIPVKFSQFKASIPGNYVFNRKLTGYLKLKTNTSTIKRNCFIISHFARAASCEVVTYAMENIPAFIEEEYMTNKSNFISKIKFELSEFKSIKGKAFKYTDTWKSVDKKIKTDDRIGGQLKKSNYFEDKLPSNIKTLNSELDKAKEVYNFIKNHYTWNNEEGIFLENNVKKAFEAKVGNVSEINISLVNALKTVGLDAHIMLLSTRDNGFATKLYPVMSDFNYLIAKITIHNKTYLLDATDKSVSFGLVPFRCLNGYGRVMDFKNGSYWFDIVPIKNSKIQLSASLKLATDGTITGKLRKASFGYDALNRRNYILNKNNEDLIDEFEAKFNDLDVVKYNINSTDEIDKPIIETITFSIEKEDNITTYYLNPFLSEQLKVNPFKQENRLYPVDYGHQRKYVVNFSLEIPENYIIESFPESKAITLPGNGASFSLISKKIENSKIILNSTIKINKPTFYNNEYSVLQILYKHIINSQKAPIVLKRK